MTVCTLFKAGLSPDSVTRPDTGVCREIPEMQSTVQNVLVDHDCTMPVDHNSAGPLNNPLLVTSAILLPSGTLIMAAEGPVVGMQDHPVVVPNLLQELQAAWSSATCRIAPPTGSTGI